MKGEGSRPMLVVIRFTPIPRSTVLTHGIIRLALKLAQFAKVYHLRCPPMSAPSEVWQYLPTSPDVW